MIIKELDVHIVDLGNFEEVNKIIKKIKPNFVFHLATYGVYPSQDNLDITIQTNILSSINIMKSFVDKKYLKRFVNVGSSFEYGAKINPVKENSILEPTTVYGISKVTQTFFATFFKKEFNLPIVTVRPFTAYDPYEEPGRLISDIMFALIKKSKLKLSSPLPGSV